jgi:hypothetical protein
MEDEYENTSVIRRALRHAQFFSISSGFDVSKYKTSVKVLMNI